jgi:hypothetical protein
MSDHNTFLEVPAYLREKIRYCGNLEKMKFFAEDWRYGEDGLHITNGIFDSSDRVEGGVVMKERWSAHKYIAFSPQYRWTIREIQPQELLEIAATGER